MMGGARSEVQADTSRVLLEVATWSGPNIHRTSWTLGLRSEASSRFEKGLAPEQCMHAQAVASSLMVELYGATRPGGDDRRGVGARPGAPIKRCASHACEAILGMPVRGARQAEILKALDFATERRSRRPGCRRSRRCGATTSRARWT